jgi:hypothetical protein
MKRLELTAIALAIAIVTSSNGMAQKYAGVSVSMFVRTVDYYGHDYTAPPGPKSTYVYFPGEPIKIEIALTNNRGDAPVRLIANPNVASNFAVKPEHGTPFNLALSSDIIFKTAFGNSPFDWKPEMMLSPGESLIIPAEVAERDSMPTGEHAIVVSTTIKDSNGSGILPHASRLQIEVRSLSNDDAPELARRAAMRAMHNVVRNSVGRDFTEAERRIDDLLKVHPQSYAAYVMRGEIAQLRGNAGQARAAYQQAINLLQTRADQRVQRDPRNVIDDLVSRIRALDAK